MKPGAIIRLAAIALGIVSATIMAQRGFEIRFNEDFLGFLHRVGEIVGVIVTPFEVLLVRPALRALHALGVEIELQEHWKYAFVLLWLLLGAAARTLGSFVNSREGAFIWIWGGFCALLASALTGTAPLSSPSIFDWPIAGFFLWTSGVAAFRALRKGETRLRAVVFGGASLICLVVAGVVALDTFMSEKDLPFFAMTPSPGLASLAAAIAVLGVMYLAFSAFDPHGEGDTWWQRWLTSSAARIGLDVLSVLGGAAFITYAAHALA